MIKINLLSITIEHPMRMPKPLLDVGWSKTSNYTPFCDVILADKNKPSKRTNPQTLSSQKLKN